MPYLDTSYDLPFASGSDTSRDAALRIKNYVGPQGDRVLAWLQSRPDGTQREAAADLNMQRASVAARFRALELRGDIGKTEDRRAGCNCYVSMRRK